MGLIYSTTYGEISIEKVKGMNFFSRLISEGSSMLIDNRMIDRFVKWGFWNFITTDFVNLK